MSLNTTALLDAVATHALSLGLFAVVNGHEPKSAPVAGVYGALWANDIRPAVGRSGLNSTSIRLEFSFRIGTDMLSEPQDDIDLTILVAASALMSAYSGGFALGGQVAEVDLLGAYGAPLSAKAGYLEQDKRLYRVMTLTIPLIVNDLFDQAP